MTQKYLIAVDHIDSSTRIANYIKKILKKNDQATIYTVLPNPSIVYNINDPAALPLFLENKEMFSILEKNKMDEMKKILEKVREILIDSGLNADNIDLKYENQRETIAHHIAAEAHNGKYDTIVIGKHNASLLSEFFLGSVTRRVIHLSKDTPVIVA